MTIDTLSLILIATMVLGAGGVAALVWDHHRAQQANRAFKMAKDKRVQDS